MADYKLNYTGEQINTAIGNAVNGVGTKLYKHSIIAFATRRPILIASTVAEPFSLVDGWRDLDIYLTAVNTLSSVIGGSGGRILSLVMNDSESPTGFSVSYIDGMTIQKEKITVETPVDTVTPL